MKKKICYILFFLMSYLQSHTQIEFEYNKVAFKSSNTTLDKIKLYLNNSLLDPIEGIWSNSGEFNIDGNIVKMDNIQTSIIVKDTLGIYGNYIEIVSKVSKEDSKEYGYKDFDIIGVYNKTSIKGVYIYEPFKIKKNIKGAPSSMNFILEKSIYLSSAQKFYSNNISITANLFAIKTYPIKEPTNENETTSKYASGTGFLLSNEGYIATNYHVIKNAKKIEVYNYDTLGFVAKTIIVDSINDVAIIKIDKKFKLDIPYKLENKCETGEKVFAIGFPEITTLGFNYKVTDGIISSQTGIKDDETCFQTTASIQHGNSGGPLFNEYGNIVGINSGGVPSLTNVFYAVKIKHLSSLIKNSKLALLPTGNNANLNKKLSEQVSNLNKFVFLIFTEN